MQVDTFSIWMQSTNFAGMVESGKLGCIRDSSIGATDVANSTFLTFNGTPLLVRQLPPKGEKPKPAVIAGPRLPKLSEQKDHDQDFEQGPWATYNSTQPAATFYRLTPCRNLQRLLVSCSPKLSSMDDKITVMMEEINFNKMKLAQPKMAEGIDARFNQVSETVEQQKLSFAQQLKMKIDLEASFEQVVNTQNSNITAGFQDIKKMFQQAHDRTPAVRRNHDMMQEDQDTSM